jgi:hypothetical protein
LRALSLGGFLLKTLLRLQDLDLKIEACKAREAEIPKQKSKYDIQRERLRAELEERKKTCTTLELEQRACEGAIEEKGAQIGKYNEQLNSVKKNEEYQALLHEIDLQKKQIGIKEERILAIMEELDEAKARVEEDTELEEAIRQRAELEALEAPLENDADPVLLKQYKRIRRRLKTGAALVPLNDEVCGGCHMRMLPQVVNEILAGVTMHPCRHCGRLVYSGDHADQESDAGVAPESATD